MVLFMLTRSPTGEIDVHPRDEEGFPLTAHNDLLKTAWKQPDLQVLHLLLQGPS